MTQIRTQDATSAHSRTTRVRALDGLRALAILLVLFTHFWSYPAGHTVINRFAWNGWVGVDLFFVLSGFLITGILWDDRASPAYYRNFYMRRALRIFPLYLLLLAFILGLQAALRPTPELLAARRDWPFYALYLSNFLLAYRGWQLLTLDITWSLAVEEQFYLCWPWGVRKMSRKTLITALIVIVAAEPLVRAFALLVLKTGWMATFMLTIFRLDGFAVGGLVALALKESLVPRDRLRQWGLVGVATLGPVLSVLIGTGWFDRSQTPVGVGTIGYTLLNLFFGSLLICVVTGKRLVRAVFEQPALCRIGVVSYGIYLLHPISATVLDGVLTRLGISVNALTRSPLLSAVLGVLVASAFAWGVAEVSFRLFETPLLRLKERFRTLTPAAPTMASEAPRVMREPALSDAT